METKEVAEPTSAPLNDLSESQLTYLQASLRHLIDHIARRIEYTESRRSVLSVTGGAILAAGLSLLTLALTRIQYDPLRWALIVFGILGATAGGLSWVLYARQTNFHYPFTETQRSWKWFYPDALSSLTPFNVPWHVWQSKRSVETARDAFTLQWQAFAQKQATGQADLRINTLEDLRQVYLLHVNERYKNLFLSHLRSVIHRGLLLAAVAAVISFAIVAARRPEPSPSQRGSQTQGDLTVDSSWREVGTTRALPTGVETEVLLNLSIANHGKASVSVREIVPIDRRGLAVPSSIELLNPTTTTIPPGSVARAQSILWIPRDLAGQIHHYEVAP